MCTSQSLFSLAALIQCTSRELLDPSDVSWRRHFQSNLFVEKEDCLLIDIGIMYRVISSFTDVEKVWFIESVWKPNPLLEFLASKETSGKQPKFEFDRTIAEVKQSRMLSVIADEATNVCNKENLLLSSAMSTL